MHFASNDSNEWGPNAIYPIRDVTYEESTAAFCFVSHIKGPFYRITFADSQSDPTARAAHGDNNMLVSAVCALPYPQDRDAAIRQYKEAIR
jgi:hypothetical protein